MSGPLKTMSINGVGGSAYLCASHKRQLMAREKLLEPWTNWSLDRVSLNLDFTHESISE